MARAHKTKWTGRQAEFIRLQRREQGVARTDGREHVLLARAAAPQLSHQSSLDRNKDLAMADAWMVINQGFQIFLWHLNA